VSGGSVKLQQALRSSSQVRFSTVTHRNPFTAVNTPLAIEGGDITVDAQSNIRRVLNLTLPPAQSVYDLLAVPGGELTVTITFRYIDNTTETLPQGVFCVNTEAMTYKQDGSITLTCPDRWWRVQSNGFGVSRSSVAANTGWQEIKRLIEGAWPNGAYPFPGWATIAGRTNPDQSATTKVGSLVWDDGDRNNAIQAILSANSLDAYFDASGLAVLQPIPALTSLSMPVWTVNDGPSGILKDAGRSRDLTPVHNVIVLSTSASDIILPNQEVANTRSPAVDPLSSLGPLGRLVFNYASPLFRSSAQMTAAGKTLLNKQLTVQQQLDVTSTPNPALDVYDVIDVVLPKGDSGTVRPVERHIIDSVTIPLTPDGEQKIAVRATRTTADDTV
jgi:hypothetical protein